MIDWRDLLACANTRPPARAWARVARGTIYYYPVHARQLALTVDDSPHPGATPALLACLEHHGARATFFCLGRQAADHPALCARIVAGGHELANHDWADRPSVRIAEPTLTRDVERTHAVLSRHGTVRWFRPGSGLVNARVRAVARRHGYALALGDVFPFDPLIRDAEFHARYLLRNARPGSIIILHDGAGRGRRTVAALDRALPALRARGYTVGTLSELQQVARTASA